MDQTQNAMMQQLGGSHSYQNPMPNGNSHFSASHNREAGAGVGKRHGFPPTPPFTSRSTSPQSFVPSQTVEHGGFHSRSHSQPAFFSLDSLPSLTPSSLSDSNDASMDDHDHEHDSTSHSSAPHPKPNSGLPPRKSHRRSRSDIPFGFLQSSPPLPPPPAVKLEGSWVLGFDATNGEAHGEKKAEGDPGDDLFTAFLNLEGLDDEKREELDSRGSSMKTNGADSSENEGESSPNESGGNSALLWANHVENKTAFPASGTTAAHHCRSLSMDSLMGKLSFVEETPKPPPSSMGRRGGQGYQANGMDSAFGKFSLEFGNGEFSAAEMKKIMSNEKLAEMAMADPKRVKRILANRQSAARSKERKMRYIAELEHKVQTLQTEATTLSAQLTLMQRDSAGLVNQNNELKFRLQAMEQQGQLRDALNEALTAEVQRLKLAARELGDSRSSNNLPQQMSIHSQMFQLQQQQQQQQSAQIPFYRLQQQQQQQQQNGAATNNESNE